MANVFEVAKSVSLISVVESYSSLVVNKSKVSAVSCPFCGHNGCFGLYGKEKNNLDKFKCFSCGKQGDSLSFVMASKGLSNSLDAAKDICSTFNLSYEEISHTTNAEYESYIQVYSFVAQLFVNWYFSSYNNDSKYFQRRGISKDVILKYGLGYCPEYILDKQGKVVSLANVIKMYFPDVDVSSLGLVNSFGDCIFADRYIFPIRNSRGDIVAFGGRSVKEGQAKYINSPNTKYFNKSSCLYNYDEAKKFQTIYVVEGYMDCLSLITAGVSNVVAAMGTAFGSTHLQRLHSKNIVLALDNDEAGHNHMCSIIESFKNIPFKVLMLKGFKDFNEVLMAGQDVKSYLTASKFLSAPEFLIKHLCSTLDLSSRESRTELWKRLASLIGSDKDNVYRKYYPVNVLYSPFDLDYYWVICSRIVKGKRGN